MGMTVSAVAASWDTTFHGGGSRNGAPTKASGRRDAVGAVTASPAGRETYHPARGADERAEPSPAPVAPVDPPGDAGNLLDRPRDLVQTLGDYRGSPRIDLPVWGWADVADRTLPAAGCIRLPADRFHAGCAARGLLE